jgi:acyl-CoA synthetase (AMP-forming)/AMP-acid ligase II
VSQGVPLPGVDPTVESATLVELLRQRARRQPERRAYTFLIDGEEQEAHLTYAELDRQARAIGALLQGYEAGGERALLIYPPGLEFVAAFFGCLYAAVVGIPAPLPRLGRSDRVLARLRAIAQDAQPRVALTTSRVLAAIKDQFGQVPELAGTRWLTTDNIVGDLAEEWWAPRLEPGALAYLQYTSGSTSTPKGVMVGHGNLWHGQRMIRDSFGHSSDSVFVGWLPHYHDMGLVGNILQPLYLGCRCVLMSPLLFLQKPLRWLRAVSRHRGTTSGGPNFAYDLCVRKISPAQRSDLDLRSWRVAFNGAEPVRAETLERFSDAFAPHGFDPQAFHPVYGLAEATLLAAGARNGSRGVTLTAPDAGAPPEDRSVAVSCGQAPPGEQIAIAEPETAVRQPPGRIGEVWLSGPNVAQGYWNRPEETSRTFRACLADTGEGPFVRTGDLGFVKDGQLFVTGRLKDLIIIRGQNYYPQDIEWTVQESDPSLRPWCCAAFSVHVAGEEQLVIVAEVEPRHRPVDVETLVGTIREAVSEQHGLHAHAVLLVEAATLPKTSSGKIQHHACRAAFLAGTLGAIGDVSSERASHG